jgi:arylsulfatase A-like enzyme
MPALARWPGKIAAGTETMTLVSTLDVLPTVLSLLGKDSISKELDGIDISAVLLGQELNSEDIDRVLFFWRDGFRDGPLGPPYGRFDVVAAKVGRIKVWFSTKSAHYNNDVEVSHDPPLLFDTFIDPAEAYPLDPNDFTELIDRVRSSVQQHKDSVDWTFPLASARDPAFIPCVDRETGCRTANEDDLQMAEIV